jgi:hypothetical protein
VLGILMALHIVVVPMLAPYTFWVVAGGLVLLLVACRLPGL